MADDSKPNESNQTANTGTSPAPTEVAGSDNAPAGDQQPVAAGGPQPDPLSDGTTPTILQKGEAASHEVPHGKAGSLGRVYRRADVITSVITFGSAIVASGLVLGIYLYLNRDNGAIKTAAPKTTTLSKDDLSKLGTYFETAGGGSTEILTVSSASLFKGRVAVDSDIKVAGGLSVTGGTSLADLTVDKNTTLGVTNVRGSLTVTGPLTLQSPAILNGGITARGDVTATGNGSFGGSLASSTINTKSLSVTGDIALAGHLLISGENPSIVPGNEAGPGASAAAQGSDAAGSVTINTGAAPASAASIGGLMANITFKRPYTRVPYIVITPVGQSAGALPFYIQKTNTGFTIGAASGIKPNTTYAFDYWASQ